MASPSHRLLSTWNQGSPSQAKSRLRLTLSATRLPIRARPVSSCRQLPGAKPAPQGRGRPGAAGWSTAASSKPRLREAGKSGTRLSRLPSPHPVPEQPAPQVQSGSLGAPICGHVATLSVWAQRPRARPPPPPVTLGLGGASVLAPPPGAPFPAFN